jgi:hypothetical protein
MSVVAIRSNILYISPVSVLANMKMYACRTRGA